MNLIDTCGQKALAKAEAVRSTRLLVHKNKSKCEIGVGFLGASVTNENVADSGRCLVSLILASIGGETDSETDKTTALVIAAGNGPDNYVRSLMQTGIDVNASSIKGNKALIAAAKHGDITCVKLLLEAGADVNAHAISGDIAFIMAATNGHEDVSKCLIENDSPFQGHRWRSLYMRAIAIGSWS